MTDMGESMEAHELLELLLFAPIPRRNTNDIAHALLKRFHTLRGVLEAPMDELMQIDGVGESAAAFLKSVCAVSRRMALDERELLPIYPDRLSVENYIRPLFTHLKNERLYMLSFDGANHMLGCDLICEGSAHAVAVNTPLMMRLLVRHAPTSVVLVHNHTNHSAVPSMDDITTTSRYRDLIESMNVSLTQHYIVAGKQITPILQW